MAHATLPAADTLCATLTKIIGRPIRGKPNKAASLAPLASVFVGTYDDGAGTLEGLWLADLPLAAYLGASLTLVPLGVANEAIRARKISPELQENAREVANITANSFTEKRVRLVHFWAPGEPVSAEAEAFAAAKGSVLELPLEVGGYGTGKLWLVGHRPAAG